MRSEPHLRLIFCNDYLSDSNIVMKNFRYTKYAIQILGNFLWGKHFY